MELSFPASKVAFSTSASCMRLSFANRRLPLSNFGSSRCPLTLVDLKPRVAAHSSPVRGSRQTVKASMAFSDNVLLHDLISGVLTLGGAMASLKFWDELARRNVFPMIVSRKLVHISVGLIFMLFWPLFSDSGSARYIAAFSVAINALRMLAIGFGIIEDATVVKAMSRGGDYRELRKGPFYYALSITFATTYLWRGSPLAPIIVANLCAGDGFADLIGRKFGKAKLPYNSKKSYVGSFAMLFFGFIVSIGYLAYFSSFGFYTLSPNLVLNTFLVVSVTTLVESLPISTKLDDNLTVPVTSFIVGALIL
ncbi:hypothetical protein GOP47_0026609 [Adiantum capillus-veneris]|nr:hypothetical protein GOP47_0026609 [Adiantum capillus-veneris]